MTINERKNEKRFTLSINLFAVPKLVRAIKSKVKALRKREREEK